ncbi:MAG TPA: response regulator transcription factor [Alcanivorax sp.]|nr:response regulator transcription factor [Alcanivorax sp.]
MNTALVVEDHPESRVWLSSLLREAFPSVTVSAVGTLAEAHTKVAEHSFNLAVVDISLPDGNGVALVNTLQTRAPDTYVVMATIYDDDEHLFAALQAGAQGYLLKDQPRARLVAQLEGIVRGEPPLSPSIARRVLRHFRRLPTSNPNGPELSAREKEVLCLLARGYTRTDIALALGISANTVAGHVKGIYRKLDVSGRAEAALQAVRLGLVDSDP